MSTNIGLWIDHKQAVIVTLTNETNETNKQSSSQTIDSHVESQPRREGDSPLKGAFETQTVHADDSHQREMTGHLNHYYDAVIKQVQNAGSILLLGPGEAKEELKKRFEGHHHAGHIVGMQTADKMTEKQIVAKVRDYFIKH